jgi:Type IV pilin-like G and H, putative
MMGRSALVAVCTVSIVGILGVQAFSKPPSEGISIQQQATSEATSNMGVIWRGLMSYHAEKGGFAKAIDQLDIRIIPKYYRYAVIIAQSSQQFAISKAIPTQKNLVAYSAGMSAGKKDEYFSILCRNSKPGLLIANPVFEKAVWKCGAGSVLVASYPPKPQ